MGLGKHRRNSSGSVFHHTAPEGWNGFIERRGSLLLGVKDSPGIEKITYRFEDIEVEARKIKDGEYEYWRPTCAALPVSEISGDLSIQTQIETSLPNDAVNIGWLKDIPSKLKKCDYYIGKLVEGVAPCQISSSKPRSYKSANSSESRYLEWTWRIDDGVLVFKNSK